MVSWMPAALRPLRHRDFRLLWTGLAVSLIGSGLWLVALAWQVIVLGGGPTELSLVTALYSVGLLAFVLVGGIAADRLPQRLVMLAADLVRTAILLVLGWLSLTGDLRIWHLAAGGLVVGAGEAFFIPSYTAILPHLLPESELLAANGLEGTLRPLAQQATGPVLGGVAVAALSPGLAISSRRLPRRYLTVMILMWGLGSLPFSVVGVAEALWVVLAALFIVGATYSAAMVIWGTLLQRRVPDGLRGRVSSLDFFVSLALMPVSMAIAGPAGAAFGLAAVFLVAGIVPGFLAVAAI